MTRKKKLTKSMQEKMEYLDYYDKLNDEEKAWIEQFYDEYYNDGVSFTENKDMILRGDKLIKEARRNHNNHKRDAFDVAKKMSKMDYDISENKDFMDAASDEWEWQDAFQKGGYELASDVIFMQALRDLNNEELDKKVTLARFYIKMESLRKEFNREKRKTK